MRDAEFHFGDNHDSRDTLSEVLSLVYVYRYRIIIAAVLVANLVLAVGWFWPKMYTSYSTVIFEQENIIQPLLEGSAVATDISARAEIARELMYSRSVLSEVAAMGGWQESTDSLLDREKRNEIIRKRLSVRPIGANLIRIEFKDESPENSLSVTDFLSETFVDKSHDMQIEESNTAFTFIDTQVKEYEEKLNKAEHALMEYNSENLATRPGNQDTVGLKIFDLETLIEATEVRIAEVSTSMKAIESRLNAEGEIAYSLDRERELNTRLQASRSQLSTLRLTYHDSYPDIVQLKSQINELEQMIATERLGRGDTTARIDDAIIDPKTGQALTLFQQLRREYSTLETEFSSNTARLTELRRQLRSEIGRGKRINENAAKLSELTRDYEVNKALHQDLLRRREAARVSMTLDQNKQGLSIRIYERAFLPLKPSGLRFVHFAALGVLMGIAIPIGFVFLMNASSKRIRSSQRIERTFGLPVIATIPHMTIDTEERTNRRRAFAAMAFAVLGGLVFLSLGLMRFLGMQPGQLL